MEATNHVKPGAILSPRLVISEELLVRFVYLWMRDARLDPADPFAQSHMEDELAQVLSSTTPLALTDKARETFARNLARLAPPEIVLR
jgi:hypothetical protein